MIEADRKKLYNQLGRIKNNPALKAEDKKQIMQIRKKYKKGVNKMKKYELTTTQQEKMMFGSAAEAEKIVKDYYGSHDYVSYQVNENILSVYESFINNEVIESFLLEAWENIIWDSMEIVLYDDGETWTRQQGSTGTDEKNIIYTLPLDYAYWSDSYIMTKDDDGDLVTDESMKSDFIEDLTQEIKEALNI